MVSPLYPGLPSPPSSFPPSLVGRAFFPALPVRASSCCCCCCCCSCCSWLGTAEETVLLSTPSCLKNQLGPNPPCHTVLVQLQDVSRERGRVSAGRTRGCVRRWLTQRKGCPPSHHLCPGGGRGRGDSMLHLSHLCPFTPYGVRGGGSEGEGVRLAGVQGARETRLTPSKETCSLAHGRKVPLSSGWG